MSKRSIGMIEMAVCAALWSIAGILMKKLSWNGFVIASLRSGIAGLTFAVYMAAMKYRVIVNRKTLLSGLITGCVYTCFACANKLTTAANAIVLQFTSPIFIVIISGLFLHKKFSKLDVITVFVTLAGISLLFLDELGGGYIFGNIVAIMAGLFMAIMFIAVGDLEAEQRFSAIMFGQFFTFLVGLPFVFTTHPVFTGDQLLIVTVLGVVQLGIPYILYVYATRSCPPLACCLLGVIEPLLNPIWVMIFDGETPGKFALIGGAIVIITVTLWCALGNRQEKSA